MITAERLREVMHYDPATGHFTRLVKTGRKGCLVGACENSGPRGYLCVSLCAERHLAHRLAWLWMTGTWPATEVDHKNGIRSDNRWCNLRAATAQQNHANSKTYSTNKTGFKGVAWLKARNKWRASITVNYKSIYLGLFDDPKEAHEAYVKAAGEHFGAFARAA